MTHLRAVALLSIGASLLAAAAGCSSDTGEAAQPGRLWWHRSLPGAMLEAKERGTLILVEYHPDENSWLENRTPEDPVLTRLLRQFALLRLSAFEHRNNKDMLFGLKNFPALLVLTRNGQVVATRSGLPSIDEYADFLAGAMQEAAAGTFAKSDARHSAPPAPDIRWLTSQAEALAEARRLHRPILILFTSQQCTYCDRLEAKTLSDPDVRALLDNFTLLKSDTDADPQFRLKHGVTGTPTTVILNEHGERLAAQPGFVPPATYAQLLASALQKAGTSGSAAPAVGSTAAQAPRTAIGKPALTWHTTLKAATDAARKNGTVVIALFTDPNCPHSVKLLGTTFADASVRSAMKDLALLKVNAKDEPALTERFGVTGTPTSVALDAEGKVLAVQRGFVEPGQYLEFLTRAVQGGTALPWHSTLEGALAAGDGKPVLAYFYAPGCAYSRKLENDTLADETVRRRLAEFTLLKINASRDRQMANKYGVTATPVSIIVDAAGDPLVVQRGYVPPERYLSFLDRAKTPGEKEKK